MSRPFFSVIAAVALSGCGLNSFTAFPYQAGLVWTASEQVTETVTTYRFVEGAPEAVIAADVLGVASNCTNAQATTDGEVFEYLTTRDWTNTNVGNTRSHHPLKPGEDSFNGIGVSVIAEEVTEQGSFTDTIDIAREDEDGDLETWQEIVAAGDYTVSGARYHGVAIDEYIVSLTPLDLWSTWEDDDAEAANDDAENNEFAGEDEGRQQFVLLSKANPSNGDIWTSTNGNVLYTFEGTEKLDVGGKSVNANRIAVHTIVNTDEMAAGLLDTCFSVTPFEFQTTQPDVDNLLTEVIALDPGCEGRFMHHTIGTEWWANNAMVAFEGTRVFVDITDYGWEWFEDDDDVDLCVRFTDTVRPTDRNDARRFVHYTVSVETSEMVVDSWEIASNDGE